MRRVLALASAAVLTVSAVLAAIDRHATRLTRDEVVLAFADQGMQLGEPTWREFGVTSTDALGTTSPEMTTRGPEGTILLERPYDQAEFYVFVAPSTTLAERYYNERVRLGPTPDTFDLRTENVLVSSDSSFTETGISSEKKARIRAAMRALASDSS